CVVSKIDLQHAWRDIVDVNAAHLDRAEIDIPILPTSALFHDMAEHEADPLLKEESHIEALASYLREIVHIDILADRHRAVAADMRSVGEHLAMVIQAELQAIKNPKHGDEIVQNLEQAEETAARLVQRTAR